MRPGQLLCLALATALIAPAPSRAQPPIAPGDEFQVNSTTYSHRYRSSTGVFPNGGFIVVWTSRAMFAPFPDTDSRAIVGQIFGSGGAPIGGEFAINN